MYHHSMSLRGGAVDGESHQSEREFNFWKRWATCLPDALPAGNEVLIVP
jgi:hypothetical protein